MSWTQVVMISFATSLLAVAIVVLGLGGAWAHFGERWLAGGGAERWTGWRTGPGRGADNLGRPCAADWSQRFDPLLRRVPAELELTPAQRPAWAAVTDSLRSSLQALSTACGASIDDGESMARLRRGEAVLQAAQAAFVKLRPPYERFLATLNARQRGKLEHWLAPRHTSIHAGGG